MLLKKTLLGSMPNITELTSSTRQECVTYSFYLNTYQRKKKARKFETKSKRGRKYIKDNVPGSEY